MVEGIKLNPMHTTMGQHESCEHGKVVCKPIGNVCELKQHKQFSNEVHTDIWGPSDVQTPGHKRFYVSFTDEYMWYTHLHLLGAKSDTFDTYQTYLAWAKMQHSTVIKWLQSNHNGKYLSKEFNHYLKSQGME